MDGRHGVYGAILEEQSWKREGQTTGEDWCLRGRARGRSLHRPAVSLNALHREAVSFNGFYVIYAHCGVTPGMVLFPSTLGAVWTRSYTHNHDFCSVAGDEAFFGVAAARRRRNLYARLHERRQSA